MHTFCTKQKLHEAVEAYSLSTGQLFWSSFLA